MLCKYQKVENFVEKPIGNSSFVNGGFFVVSKSVLKFIKNDQTSWEQDTLKELTRKKEVMAFKHSGFWQAIDTLRDKNYVESLWNKKKAPWKIWKK